MPYTYEYMNKITQFGVINYTLKLTDSDGIHSDIFMPVIISEFDDNENNLKNIADKLIDYCMANTKITSVVEDTSVVETIDSLSATSIDSLSATSIDSLSAIQPDGTSSNSVDIVNEL